MNALIACRPTLRTVVFLAGLLAATLLPNGCGTNSQRPGQATEEAARAKRAGVDGQRLRSADTEPGNWMSYGRTYSEQHFSPLTQINDQNVARLGLAWYFDLDTRRGQEATPLVIDGVMYFTSAWSKVHALNAASGREIWSFDPKVDPAWAINACCEIGRASCRERV